MSDHHHHEHKHEHEHHHESGSRGKILQITVAAVLLIAAAVIEHNCTLPLWQLLLIYLVPYLLAGHETLHEAAEGIVGGDAFDENFLMSVASIGALAIGFMPGAEPQFTEAVAVMLFFQIGELFEAYAEGHSRDSISHLMDIRPDVAHVEREGETVSVAPDAVAVGEIIVVRPGEKVPLDGEIVEGQTTLDTAALTGESVPRHAGNGDTILSGCINLTGVVRVRTTKSFGQSTVSRIISLIEDASEHKSRSEAFITRFARIYTPVVVTAALVLAIVPPVVLTLASGHALTETAWLLPCFSTWLYRALMFLVVSCPCALVISVPLTFFGGIGGASRQGILIKGANYIDQLARVNTVMLDKTGTLTEGVFAVQEVHAVQGDTDRLLHMAALAEQYSTHPIAAALRDACHDINDGGEVANIEELAGHGIRACIDGKLVSVGNDKLMRQAGIDIPDIQQSGTVIHVAEGNSYAGYIIVGDRIKESAATAIGQLRQQGVSRCVMLTGDHQAVAESVASQVGVDAYKAELLPTDKVEAVRQEQQREGAVIAFVGDGINDAPVLALADVGIAMGALGSDAAIEAADVVLMDDKPERIVQAISIARRTLNIAHQNVIFAIGVKVLVLLLAALGWANMWMAVFADVGVTVIAVLNATRSLMTSHKNTGKASARMLLATALLTTLLLASCMPQADLDYAQFRSFTYVGHDTRYEIADFDPTHQYINPIISGTNPDPSVCRRDSDYYMVNSSYAYWPGVPLWKSRDLVHWQRIGSILARKRQLDLKPGLPITSGIAAPDIAYNPDNDTFYMIVSDVGQQGTLMVKSQDPERGWSEPILLPSVGGTDPALLFAGDGHAYIINSDRPDTIAAHANQSAIWLREYDVEADTCMAGARIIAGMTSAHEGPAEQLDGPHLYHIGDTYFLMCTATDVTADAPLLPHLSEMLYCSDSPWGPFEPCKINPILTQQGLDASSHDAIVYAGHADLVQAVDEAYWAVCSGCTVPDGDAPACNTGRSTCLLPVEWQQGQPVILPAGRSITTVQDIGPSSARLAPLPDGAEQITGNVTFGYDPVAGPDESWMTLRSPYEKWMAYSDTSLIIIPRYANLDERAQPSMLCHYVMNNAFTVTTVLDYTYPNDAVEAGLTYFINEEAHYEVCKKRIDGRPALAVYRTDGDSKHQLLASQQLTDAEAQQPVTLVLDVAGQTLTFSYSLADAQTGKGSLTQLAPVLDARLITAPHADARTGAIVGMYAEIRR